MRARAVSWAGLFLLIALAPTAATFALISGGEGNDPLQDPGWPSGAAAIVNHQGRVAYWEGPPFGGGEFHAECRSDAAAFNAVLEQFAELDIKKKQLIVNDGIGNSFWLNPNGEPEKRKAAAIDWSFMVWVPDSWQRLRDLPPDINPTNPADADSGPPSVITVYTGGSIRWQDVIVPQGLEVIDNRLEAHGFQLADGKVLEGKVMDAFTQLPLSAEVRLELVAPQKTGGYAYELKEKTVADKNGHWVLKNAPEGWFRVVVQSRGYVPRLAGYARFDDQPGWHSYNTQLSQSAPVSGRVTDEQGQPLEGVNVRLADVVTKVAGRYETPNDYQMITGKDGRFSLEEVPVGTASIWVHKEGYCHPGLGPTISTPTNNVMLKMIKAAQLKITVDFSDSQKPEGYLVNLEPEGGSKIGSYGGSGNINDNNEMTFSNVPPGRYVVTGMPNPGSENQRTEPITVELQGGETTAVSLKAK